ncbi:MAG: S41 family peptidase [Oscillospiraceae bacterium]|nr:S41 family peptidase [Oscillospiraceae bacterium]
MKKSRFWLTAIALALLCSGLTFVITYASLGRREVSPGATSLSPQALKALEVGQYIDTYFIDEYDTDEMNDAIASAMVESTGDRWSYYISANDLDRYFENLTNSYVGIGVTVNFDETQGLIVDAVTPGSPAAEAGILPGDVITAVEGESTAEMGLNAARDRIRGQEGTKVSLTVLHDGAQAELFLTRRSIQTEVVHAELFENNVGYIRIANFDESCASQSIAAIESLMAKGADKLLFDVRFNPGGMKDELCELLDYLLPEGIIFQSVNYRGQEEIIRSDKDCLELPMAVLINGDSYSAAEFFAAALQEYGVAKVVGTQTVGKGFYQQTYLLSDGSAVALSSGRYRTPNGVSLAGVGLTPDVELDLDDEMYYSLYSGTLAYEDDPQMQAALEILVP